MSFFYERFLADHKFLFVSALNPGFRDGRLFRYASKASSDQGSTTCLFSRAWTSQAFRFAGSRVPSLCSDRFWPILLKKIEFSADLNSGTTIA
ncbi:hypothetical protein L2088_27990 [Pseudomonas protegens]|uniref:hypothetical protein n=1 Tax=Pseudomonas protegens TaxID=380021 RepID=UPI0020252929|nr:hypothetical protein [Pseudomonas protegens]MCL9658561.1 hypothetical protein [Pseudomonas protegens]